VPHVVAPSRSSSCPTDRTPDGRQPTHGLGLSPDRRVRPSCAALRTNPAETAVRLQRHSPGWEAVGLGREKGMKVARRFGPDVKPFRNPQPRWPSRWYQSRSQSSTTSERCSVSSAPASHVSSSAARSRFRCSRAAATSAWPLMPASIRTKLDLGRVLLPPEAESPSE
jgi:hypothetical protein